MTSITVVLTRLEKLPCHLVTNTITLSISARVPSKTKELIFNNGLQHGSLTKCQVFLLWLHPSKDSTVYQNNQYTSPLKWYTSVSSISNPLKTGLKIQSTNQQAITWSKVLVIFKSQASLPDLLKASVLFFTWQDSPDLKRIHTIQCLDMKSTSKYCWNLWLSMILTQTLRVVGY